ncbi:MAG: MFS transporter [Treponema sp.]|jgi:sugar (glycoside-pentoside-hexuronide) transporter|nr:MFS transporter [Treponema sp.]
MPAKRRVDFQTGRAERIAFPLYSLGQSLSYSFVTGYMMLFYTDYIFIPAYAVSVILLIAKVWDAVNDPLFGIIVDRTNFKGGKFIPWLRVASFGIPLSSFLVFIINPALSMAARIVLVVLTYFLWDFTYTLSDVPFLSILTVMTGNLNERTSLISLTGIASVAGAVIISVILVPQLETLGFVPIAGILALASFAFMIWFPFTARERNRVQPKVEEKYKIRDVLTYVKGNKYLLYFFVSFSIFGLFNIPLGNYVLIHCLGSLTYVAYYTIVSVPLIFLVNILLPKMTKKYDRLMLYRIILGLLIMISLGQFFAGYSNWIVYGVFYVIRYVLVIAAMILIITFATDFVEYGQYKTGFRKESITFSVEAFCLKFVGAGAAALGALMLGLIKYDGILEVQAPETIRWIWILSNFMPIAGIILSLPLFFKCDFKCSDIQIMADINVGKISREDGDTVMSRKY